MCRQHKSGMSALWGCSLFCSKSSSSAAAATPFCSGVQKLFYSLCRCRCHWRCCWHGKWMRDDGEREREQWRLCRHSRHAAECNQLENYLRIWATARYSNLKIKVKQTKRREKNIQKRIERNQRRRRRRSTLTLTSLHVWQNVSHNVDCVQQLLLLLLLVLLLLLLLLCTHSSTLWLGWPGDFKAIPSWERERVLVSVCLCQCMCVLLTSDPSN